MGSPFSDVLAGIYLEFLESGHFKFIIVMNKISYLLQNTSVSSFLERLQPTLKDEFLGCFVSFVAWLWQHLCKFVPIKITYKTANFVIQKKEVFSAATWTYKMER